MKCLKCGFIANHQEFIADYFFDEELNDEIPSYQCPQCGNDDDNLIVDD